MRFHLESTKFTCFPELSAVRPVARPEGVARAASFACAPSIGSIGTTGCPGCCLCATPRRAYRTTRCAFCAPNSAGCRSRVTGSVRGLCAMSDLCAPLFGCCSKPPCPRIEPCALWESPYRTTRESSDRSVACAAAVSQRRPPHIQWHPRRSYRTRSRSASRTITPSPNRRA